MSDFIEQLRLAEKAAEDIYFARINRELIESMHRRHEEKQPVPVDTEQVPCRDRGAGPHKSQT